MKLEFKRSGGFAGITTKRNVDVENVEASTATKLKELLAKLPDFKSAASSVADGFCYEFAVEDNGAEKHYKFNDGDLTDDLQELVDCVLDLPKGE